MNYRDPLYAGMMHARGLLLDAAEAAIQAGHHERAMSTLDSLAVLRAATEPAKVAA